MTRSIGPFEIRPLGTLDEYRQCVALQEATWGVGFSERVPTAILRASQRLGGVAAGAYDPDGDLLGFVFGMTGLDPEGPVHWSDMLAVREDCRDTGLGTALKLHQRRVLLERGVTRMLWTFDPLQSRNAYVNLRRLGATSREYVRDMYGQTDSPLHHGIGTDRMVATWAMASDRVRTRLSGALGSQPELARARVGLGHRSHDAGHPTPADPRPDLRDPVISVAIPADIDALKNDRPDLAAAWRDASRLVLESYLDRGYEARDLVRDGQVSHYLLESRTVDES